MAERLTKPDPINIDKYIGKTKQRIYLVGIELEGGWAEIPQGTTIIRDGSVHVDGDAIPPEMTQRWEELNRRLTRDLSLLPAEQKEFQKLSRDIGAYRPKPGMVGEIPSPPLQLDQWEKWMDKYFPKWTNESCGLHVHMSFRSAGVYQRLMDPRYQDTICEYVRKWAEAQKLSPRHHIFTRIAGKSEFCRRQYYAEQQIRQTTKDYDKARPGHRYTIIHYPYSRTGTIECRLLPMFPTVEQSKAAVREVLRITNATLVALAKKETKFAAILKAEDDHFREERIVRV